MEALRRALDLLLDELERRTGLDAAAVRRWFADSKRRRLMYAVSMFALSLLILLVYACSQRPDV